MISERRALIVFFSIFTLIYMTVSLLWTFFLPFIIAMLIAVVMRPLYNFFKRKFSFQSAFCATVITISVFALLLSAAVFVLYLVVREFLQQIEPYGELINRYFSDTRWLTDAYSMLSSAGAISFVSDIASGVIRLIPAVISFCVFTFALTVYFLNRLCTIRDRLIAVSPDAWRIKTRRTLDCAYSFVRRFIRSYSVLYLITFAEATFIFCLTGVRYPLYLGFVTALADVLPILGPGAVYLPIALRFILYGNYISGIILVVFFLITVIIRQIIEPRIVSDSIKISPLIILSAIYFSVVSMSVGVFFYILLLMLCYRILRAAEVL